MAVIKSNNYHDEQAKQNILKMRAVLEKLEPSHLHFALLCGETPQDPLDFVK